MCLEKAIFLEISNPLDCLDWERPPNKLFSMYSVLNSKRILFLCLQNLVPKFLIWVIDTRQHNYLLLCQQWTDLQILDITQRIRSDVYKLSVPTHHYCTVRASKRACADLRKRAHQCLMLVELLSYDTKEPRDSCFTLYLYCGVFHYFYQLFFFFASSGMEHVHMWVCQNPEWTQARNSLFTVSGSFGC